jgi:2,4-dienoyl-CoA reductase-like NADH-dependent reductase (Old Yellow Enzyme family)/thioredoxin reductase
MNHYKHLFSALQVGGQTLKNRIVLSPMTTNLAGVSGELNDAFIQHLVARARGGAGLIITDIVTPDSTLGKPLAPTSLDTPFHSTLYHALADGVHAYDSKVMVQLDVDSPDYSKDPVEQAATRNASWTKEQIQTIVESYARAASYLQMAGIDGVMLQASGGYFFHQFLSPLSNHRQDEYNGNVRARAKVLTDTISAIRQTCGQGFLIDVRLAIKDYVDGGITLEEGIESAKLCEIAGADMLNIYGGFCYGDDLLEVTWRPDGDRVHLAAAVKSKVGIPVAANGKIKTARMANDVIAAGQADLVFIGRPFLADADWAIKSRLDREEDIRPCLTCNECASRVVSLGPVKCSVNPYLGHEWEIDESSIPLAPRSRNIVVVGAGPAGLQAATVAAKRGHHVTILEQGDKAGGQLNLAAVPPHKEAIGLAAAYLEREALKSGVEIQTGTKASLDAIMAFDPDAVLLCTGAEPNKLPVSGVENAIQAWDVLSGKAGASGKATVVIGGGIVGVETAMYLAKRGGSVTVLEIMEDYATEMEFIHKAVLPEVLKKAGITVVTSASVTKIGRTEVIYEKSGESLIIFTDQTVLATGQHPIETGLLGSLYDRGIETYVIGDAAKCGKIKDAINNAFAVACNL